MTETYQVATEIDSWCTKCREMRRHTIKSLVEEKPKRVICLTCDGEHNYRPNIPKSRQKDGGKKQRKKRLTKKEQEAIALAEDYKRRVEELSPADARKFSIRESFDVDDVVKHKKFGIGFVVDVIEGDKIRIHFEDGHKLMVHNR